MAKVEFQPGGLIVGDYPAAVRHITIEEGQELAAGSVIGHITASDTYALSDDAAEDGSEDPVAVVPVAVDASGGDVVAPAFFSGEFAADQLVFGGDHDADTVEAAFRVAGLPIFVRKRV